MVFHGVINQLDTGMQIEISVFEKSHITMALNRTASAETQVIDMQ